MLWVVLGLTCACFKAVLGACMRQALLGVDKKRFGDFHAGHFLLLAVCFASTAVALIGFLAWDGIPKVQDGFWSIVALVLALEIVAQTLTSISLSIEDLSVVDSFSPLNLVLVGALAWTMLGEVPSAMAMVGAMGIICGAVWLSFPTNARRPRLSAVTLRIISLICFAFITPNFKLAIQHSSPYYFAMVHQSCTAILALLVLACWAAVSAHQRAAIRAVAGNRAQLARIGTAAIFAHIPQYVGMILAPIVYFMALNRLAPIFSIAIGYFWLKERDAFRRLPAVLLMIAGAVLVIFGR